MTIQRILAREILDCRGNPTVEVEIVTDRGITGSAIGPGGNFNRLLRIEEQLGNQARFAGKSAFKSAQ